MIGAAFWRFTRSVFSGLKKSNSACAFSAVSNVSTRQMPANAS